MVSIMRSLVYIFVSVFCVVLFSSCAVRENLQARIEHRRLFKEMQFSLDSIKKIASAYEDDNYGHTYEFCNWQNRNSPSYVFFFGTKGGGFTHFSDGRIFKNYDTEDTCLWEGKTCSTTISDSCNKRTLEPFERECNVAYLLSFGLLEYPIRDMWVTKEMDEFFTKR